MGKNLGTKLAIILAVLLFFIYGIIGPHSTEHGFKYSPKQALADNIHLGLDLKGGTHLVGGVHVAEALAGATDRDVQRIETALQGGGITGAVVSKPDAAHPEVISITGLNAQQASQARSLVGTNEYSQYDVAGQPDGSVRLTMKQSAISDLEKRTLATTIEVINDRINKLGVSEPLVQPYGLGANQILIELPGEADPTRIENAIQSKDKLEIHAVDGNPAGFATDQDAIAGMGGSLPPDDYLVHGKGTANAPEQVYVLKRVSEVEGTDFRDARPGTDINGRPNITFNLTTEAGERFFKYTDAHKSTGPTPGSMAIVLGNQVKEVASINSGIRDSGEITGAFTQAEADNLSLMRP